MTTRVVHLVGLPATGKSTLAAYLSSQLNLPHLSIETERLVLMGPRDAWPANDARAWQSLRDQIASTPSAIVETSGLAPDRDLFALAKAERYTILTMATAAVRQARLAQRVATGHRFAAHSPNYVATIMAFHPVRCRPDLTLSTTNGIAPAILDRLATNLRAWIDR